MSYFELSWTAKNPKEQFKVYGKQIIWGGSSVNQELAEVSVFSLE